RGDRIKKFNDAEVTDAKSLGDLVSRNRPGDNAKLTYVRDGQEATVDVVLGFLPEDVVAELPTEIIAPVSTDKNEDRKDEDPDVEGKKPANPDEKKSSGPPKTGRFADKLEGYDHDYWAYVPEGYNPDHAYGLIVWIHPGGDSMEATISKEWKSVC